MRAGCPRSPSPIGQSLPRCPHPAHASRQVHLGDLTRQQAWPSAPHRRQPCLQDSHRIHAAPGVATRPVQALQDYSRGAPASQLERCRPAAPGPFSTLQLKPSPLTWQVVVLAGLPAAPTPEDSVCPALHLPRVPAAAGATGDPDWACGHVPTKPRFTAQDKQERLEFAKKHVDHTLNYWYDRVLLRRT